MSSRSRFRVAASVAAVCVAAACGGSTSSGGPSSPSVSAATIATVLTAARTDLETVFDRDYATPQQWFARAGKVTNNPLRVQLAVDVTSPADHPRSGRTSLTVSHVALASLNAKAAYVVVAGTATATSTALGPRGAVGYLVSLDRVGGTWLLSTVAASGIPGIDQSFATADERAAIRAAVPAFEAVFQLGTYNFDADFTAAARGLTGSARTAFLASRTSLRSTLSRERILHQDPEVTGVGVEKPGSSSVTLLVPWSAEITRQGVTSRRDTTGGVTQLSMTEVDGVWLIAAIRPLG